MLWIDIHRRICQGVYNVFFDSSDIYFLQALLYNKCKPDYQQIQQDFVHKSQVLSSIINNWIKFLTYIFMFYVYNPKIEIVPNAAKYCIYFM
jgi:hypothetical protein